MRAEMSKKKFKKIISGSGSSPFRQLYKFTEKTKKKNLSLQKPKVKKIIYMKQQYGFDQERDFTKWEREIIKKIEKSGLKFETKFFKFPLNIGNKKFIYVPDLLMKDFFFNEKKIILEAHEKISEDDIAKYRKFRSIYGNVYHLLLVVTDNELRKWNEYDQKEGVFHEIWTSNNVDFLIKNLQEKRAYYIEKNSTVGTHVCPPPPRHGCGKTATGYDEIKKEFGMRKRRNGEEFPQSLCYDRRSKHAKRRRRN